MEMHIVLIVLYIKHIVEVQTLQLIVGLDIYSTVVEGILLMLVTEPLHHFLCRTYELIIRDWFQQIVDGVHLITLDGILRKGCCQDNFCGGWYDLRELQSTEVRHLNVEIYQVNPIITKILYGIHSVGVTAYKIQIRGLCDIALQ
jgi:hypothetical protein